MKERLYKFMDADPLILHKVGFALGAIIGAIAGLFISDRADQFEMVVEEVADESTES